ncbi:MAG: divalent-cation tolerance protein CutA [Nanoarchaeota archaeon]
MPVIAVYITCKDEKEAKAIALHLLNEKLIACANASEHKAFYTWKGRLVQEREWHILAKSRRELFPRIASAVKKLHSAELPCIVCWDIDGDKEYLTWIQSETT